MIDADAIYKPQAGTKTICFDRSSSLIGHNLFRPIRNLESIEQGFIFSFHDFWTEPTRSARSPSTLEPPSPMGQENLAVLTGDRINEEFYTRKYMAVLLGGQKKCRPIRLTLCCTQFKPSGIKTFCFRNFHII